MKILKNLILILFMGITYHHMECWSRWNANSLLGFVPYTDAITRLSLAGWSSQWMVLVGGLAGFLVGLLNEYRITRKIPTILCGLIGVLVFTWPLELFSGLILNKGLFFGLHLGIWDYSHMPLNVMGQITVAFLPIFLSVNIFAIWLDDVLRHWILGEVRPEPFYIFILKAITFKSS